MKNPDDMRLVIAAVTLWILRFAQNDSSGDVKLLV